MKPLTTIKILLCAMGALLLLNGCKTNPDNWIEKGGWPLVPIWQNDAAGK